MFDPVKHLGQGEETRNAGEDSLRPGRSESSPAARPAEGDLGPGRRGGFAAGASTSEESVENERLDAEALGEAPSGAVSDDAAPPLPPNLVASAAAVLCGSEPNRDRFPRRPNSGCSCWILGSGAVCRPATLRRWSASRSTRCSAWKKRFEELGPAGLLGPARGVDRRGVGCRSSPSAPS